MKSDSSENRPTRKPVPPNKVGAPNFVPAPSNPKPPSGQLQKSQDEAAWSRRDIHVEVLADARKAVNEIVHEGEQPPPARISLFLEQHYPFFDEEVQSILRARHPDHEPRVVRDSAYAMDAYLWAEQYGWLAYDDSSFKDSQFIDHHASLYLTGDLRWFSRLLTGIAAAIEKCIHCAQSGPGLGTTHEIRLQRWRNFYVVTEGNEEIKKPNQWLAGTKFGATAIRYKGRSPNPSLRVSAARINKQRRTILKSWLPCWKAELRVLDDLLQYEARLQR